MAWQLALRLRSGSNDNWLNDERPDISKPEP